MISTICSCGHGVTEHWGVEANAASCHGWDHHKNPCPCLEFNEEHVPSDQRREIVREFVENAWDVYITSSGANDSDREAFEAGLFTALLNIKNSLVVIEQNHRFWCKDVGWAIPAVEVAQLRDSIIDVSDGKIA